MVAVFRVKLGPKVGIRDRSQFVLLAASAGMPGLAPFEAFLQDYAAFWIELFLRGEGKHQTQRMLVVYRHPGVPAQFREFRLGWYQDPEWQEELVHPPVQLIVL